LRKMFAVLAMMALVPSFSFGAAQSVQTQTAQRGFCFHGAGVNLPIGYFLLIRKGTQVGALRILKITPNHQIESRANEWIGTVDYESYFGDSANSALAKGKKVSSTLHFGQMKGFGFHYSWQSGNREAVVGPWRFLFFNQDGMFTTSVDFWHGVNDDSGHQFAATNAAEVNQIKPNDSTLQWFSYDQNRDIPCPVIPLGARN
jgi:hypothetical protein